MKANPMQFSIIIPDFWCMNESRNNREHSHFDANQTTQIQHIQSCKRYYLGEKSEK